MYKKLKKLYISSNAVYLSSIIRCLFS